MARPLKKGLGYFPLDTDMLSDRKIRRLVHRYGCKGICTYLTVLCEIYGERGYYIPYNDDFCFDIAFTIDLEEVEVKEIILYCVEVRLFDSELLECRQVLSSAGIQRRFREISRRSGVTIDPDLEIPDDSVYGRVIAAETGGIATETPVIVTETLVSAAKKTTNINGNKNVNTTTQHGKSNEAEFSIDNGESARREELIRMAEEATRGC
ncbi:DUF4373 domain-containing protein [Parabacteroides sp.]